MFKNKIIGLKILSSNTANRLKIGYEGYLPVASSSEVLLNPLFFVGYIPRILRPSS